MYKQMQDVNTGESYFGKIHVPIWLSVPLIEDKDMEQIDHGIVRWLKIGKWNKLIRNCVCPDSAKRTIVRAWTKYLKWHEFHVPTVCVYRFTQVDRLNEIYKIDHSYWQLKEQKRRAQWTITEEFTLNFIGKKLDTVIRRRCQLIGTNWIELEKSYSQIGAFYEKNTWKKRRKTHFTSFGENPIFSPTL